MVAIDEGQFFGEDLVSVCNKLAEDGIRVIIAGLDMDFSGKPFGVIPKILAIADDIIKVHAVCSDCRNRASFSFRKSEKQSLVELGGKDEYKALCRNCFTKAMS